MINKQIVLTGLKTTFETNLFISEEESNLYNLEKYCSNFFGSNVKKLSKNNSEVKYDGNFFSCLGALKIIKDGWETEAIPEPVDKNNKKISFFAKIFGNAS